MSIEQTLKKRGRDYGAFTDHAKISQGLKDVIRHAPKWVELRDNQKESLEMIVHKIARILNGNPAVKDSWHDIEGYARLVSNTLK